MAKGKSLSVKLKPTKAGIKALKKPGMKLELSIEGRDRGIGLWQTLKTVKLAKPKVVKGKARPKLKRKNG